MKPCTKQSYKHAYDAMKHLQWIRRKTHNKRKPVAVYTCPKCKMYHLTSTYNMLKKEQIDLIVDKINKEVNIPIIGEKVEEVFIRFAVKAIVRKLEEIIPREWFENVVNSAADGVLNDDEAAIEAAIERASIFINAQVNVPFIDEHDEYFVIELVVREVFSALRKGVKL